MSETRRSRRMDRLRRAEQPAVSHQTRVRQTNRRVSACQHRSVSPVCQRRPSPLPGPEWAAPQREYRQKAAVSQLFFAVRAHVFEKQVAKCDPFDSRLDCSSARFSHQQFVLLVRTRPGQRDIPKRQTGCRACCSTSSRRTACIATRSAASLNVVSSPAMSYSRRWRRTCKLHALSLPLLQERRIRFIATHSLNARVLL